jgi:hypothetical protein
MIRTCRDVQIFNDLYAEEIYGRLKIYVTINSSTTDRDMTQARRRMTNNYRRTGKKSLFWIPEE